MASKVFDLNTESNVREVVGGFLELESVARFEYDGIAPRRTSSLTTVSRLQAHAYVSGGC
jgi:hypothetical protein